MPNIRETNISNSFAASLSFVGEEKVAEYSLDKEDTLIEKYAGMDIYQPTVDNVENFVPITVSIAEYGLTFSKAAVEVMGRPQYVMLAYDKTKRIVGVMPVSENESKKIEFISKIKNGYVRINTKDFVRFLMKFYPDNPQMFGSKATRYFSYWDEEQGMLIIDLKRPLDQQNDEEKERNDADSDDESFLK
jgi:hypothetical protein